VPVAESDMDLLRQENEELRDVIAQMKGRIDVLERLADSDTLTPLPNRRAFLRRLEALIKQVARHDTPAAVLFIDLDGLKRINDDFGHQAGDSVLLHVAEQLSLSLRTTDMVARIGGDEFGLILDHLDEEDANTKAASLVAMIASQPVDVGPTRIDVSVTVGVAAVKSTDTVERLLDRADNAMYAKRLYRSQT
jgi:diguanylate cyclase (GGDEF)-like protein